MVRVQIETTTGQRQVNYFADETEGRAYFNEHRNDPLVTKIIIDSDDGDAMGHMLGRNE